MLVGDASDYATLLQMMLGDAWRCRRVRRSDHPRWRAAPKAPLGVAALRASAPICSCRQRRQRRYLPGGELRGAEVCRLAPERLTGASRAGETGDKVSAGGAGRRSEKDVCEHFP
ncbi:hypothetical protein MJ561_17910 [Klebsiella pneumoniae]|nr:hypothetical protein MJ561_17910 [Klebsiella pneumoniae]